MTVVFLAFLVPQTHSDMLAVQTSWRQAGALYPFMFHAQAVAASGLLMVVWQNENMAASILKDRLEHQSYALRAMHDVLTGKETTLISDVLIKAILALGYFSGEPVRGKIVWIHPSSPMATAQVSFFRSHVSLLRVRAHVSTPSSYFILPAPSCIYFSDETSEHPCHGRP